MGWYIETNTAKNKAGWIVNNMHGKVQTNPHYTDGDYFTVCVVDNGPFEAAGVCFSELEFQAFSDIDDLRPKVYLTVPREEVYKKVPYLKDYMHEVNLPT